MSESWETLFAREPGRVHVMGICGVGASGIAWMLYLRGWQVSGCDKLIPPIMGAFFRHYGITISQGHDVAHSVNCDVLIYSAAIDADEPELKLARAAGVLCIPRGKALAAWIKGLRSVAVCGTHGKTTTSCFTTRLLMLLNANPLWCLGGSTKALVATSGPVVNVRPNQSLPPPEEIIAVAEADESDGTLADDCPEILVLTNIDLDHVDHFASEEALEACFMRAIENTRHAVAVCAENPRAIKVATCCTKPVLTYGFTDDAVVQAVRVKSTAESSSFDLMYKTKILEHVELPIPGTHNILNALGAFSAAVLLGFDPEKVAALLPQACDELPIRRFQWISRDTPVRIVVDYSHHPVEIKAAMSIAVLQKAKRLRVVFQPHRYSRTRMFLKDFPEALADADEVIIQPVYEASERLVTGGESHDLYAAFREQNPAQRVLLARSLEETEHYLKVSAAAGDLILIIGAGDVVKLGQTLSGAELPLKDLPDYLLLKKYLPDSMKIQQRVPLNSWSLFGTGGLADVVVEVESIPELSALLMLCAAKHIPVRCAGLGANRWWSDLGTPGVVFRLTGKAFCDYHRNGMRVTVGAGMLGASMLKMLEADELSGLEFMEGIPGRVGGWVKMNAGAAKGAVWDCIAEVRGITRDGQLRHARAAAFLAGYRSVNGLKDFTLIDVTFYFTKDTPEAIRARRQDYAKKRIPIQGLRTCGSIFRNPATDPRPAGAILDALGAKAWRVGGAYVTDVHANIIATTPHANSSDVLALMEKMRSIVYTAENLHLDNEVKGFSGQE